MDQMMYDQNMMGMYPGMMPGMQMPQQEEMTEEQKAEMEARAKEEEKRRRKAQIESLKTQIKSKTLVLKVMERGIVKVVAEKDVLVNVDLSEAPTEWHKKAVKAQAEELEAIIEEAKLRLEADRSEFENMKERLKSLEEADERDAEDGSSGSAGSPKGERKESKKDENRNYL